MKEKLNAEKSSNNKSTPLDNEDLVDPKNSSAELGGYVLVDEDRKALVDEDRTRHIDWHLSVDIDKTVVYHQMRMIEEVKEKESWVELRSYVEKEYTQLCFREKTHDDVDDWNVVQRI